jgi:protein-tyrosine phosphatase
MHWIDGISPHRLAVMPRPRGGEGLAGDVAAWKRAGLDTVVCLLEAHEARFLEVADEAELCARHGIEYIGFPIADRGVPTSHGGLVDLVTGLHTRLRCGQAIAIHCRAGIGRTGLVAGCLLHLLGVPHEEVFHRLSRARGFAMPDTAEQAAWVERFARTPPHA